ncbi:helix-turn-helix transcriptional regulator [Atopobium sp. oral taxon 810]|uniref:helix-turn-helix domain-containing protein n=1 Tax=Atopobium sp. oral taxon 810 TaxID=712158 RepID=UPI0003F6C598|nr:helix-turn-helix transcriptional regulator [Atopobium sp. oral taxon 810]
MPIILHVDDLLRKKGCTVQELADAVGISRVNMSHIKTGDIRALRLSTLDGICAFFDCQPGDVLEHIPDDID